MTGASGALFVDPGLGFAVAALAAALVFSALSLPETLARTEAARAPLGRDALPLAALSLSWHRGSGGLGVLGVVAFLSATTSTKSGAATVRGSPRVLFAPRTRESPPQNSQPVPLDLPRRDAILA